MCAIIFESLATSNGVLFWSSLHCSKKGASRRRRFVILKFPALAERCSADPWLEVFYFKLILLSLRRSCTISITPVCTAISNGDHPSFPSIFGLTFRLNRRYSVISILPEPHAACKQLKPEEPIKFRSRSLVLGLSNCERREFWFV